MLHIGSVELCTRMLWTVLFVSVSSCYGFFKFSIPETTTKPCSLTNPPICKNNGIDYLLFCVCSHSNFYSPCVCFLDTFCGLWEGRKWKPNGCHYRDISAEEARKCVDNRTLTFIGDSQIRDFGIGVSFFLSGMRVSDGVEYKVDKASDYFKPYDHRCYDAHRYIFPLPGDALKHNYQWQVQCYELYNNLHIKGDPVKHKNNIKHFHVHDVLTNAVKCNHKNSTSHIRPSDVAFWHHG